MDHEFTSLRHHAPLIRSRRPKQKGAPLRKKKIKERMSNLVRCMTRKRWGILIFLGVLSMVFLMLAVFFNEIINDIVHDEMKEKLPIRNGSFAFKFWQKPPVPISFSIYVFDITNPDEILAGTEPPAVVERGPYVYMMHIEKTNIVWHDNGTVEYVQPQTFIFNREASVGSDDDNFTTINIPYITVATILQYEYPFLQKAVDAYFISKNEDTFKTLSVHDIWWGYEDPVLLEVEKVAKKFNISLPIFNGKFGFYMDKNNTGDGLYNVYSGTNGNFDNFVTIDKWNGFQNLSIWKSDYANGIRGTDGSMQPPYIDSSRNLSIFDAYLYRSLKLVYNGSSSFREIETLRYYVPYSEFTANEQNPENIGFCTPDLEHCLPSGLYNLSEATYFAPMYVSMPHFVGGDPYYQQQVMGLKPSQLYHQPFYDIHALTGISMRAARRYQIVVRTQSFEYFSKFKNFPVSYIPVLWIDGLAEIDVETASMLKSLMQEPMNAMPYVRIAIFISSALFLLTAFGLVLLWTFKNRTQNLYTRIEDSEEAPIVPKKSNRAMHRSQKDQAQTMETTQADRNPNSLIHQKIADTIIQTAASKNNTVDVVQQNMVPSTVEKIQATGSTNEKNNQEKTSFDDSSYYDSVYYNSFETSGENISTT